MKKVLRLLNILFRPRGQILIALLLFTAITIAQESTPEEFVIDCGGLTYKNLFIDTVYNSFIQCGFNTMTQRATNDSKSYLERFNLNAINDSLEADWIYFYSSAYYSKWEAEEDKQSKFEVGVKHSAGDTSTWKGVKCWSTKGITQPVDTLVYGPTYHQAKWYKRWLYMHDVYNLKYTPRFNMALEVKGNVSPDDSVCRIYVLLRYRRKIGKVEDNDDSTYILKEPVILSVSDFADSGKFKLIYFSENPIEQNYKYSSLFKDPITYKMQIPSTGDTIRFDTREGQGVQFCIDWLRSDTLCTLYIDNIEVYDNYGWNRLVTGDSIAQRIQEIKDYAESYNGWINMKHWLGGHEPHTIDAYTPIRVIDSLIQEVGAPPLMNTVWGDWTLKLNGELQLERYYNTVQPEQLLIEFHPVSADYDTVRPFDLEVVRRILQEGYRLTQDKKFYFHIQTYGEKKGGQWHVWRQPTIPEYKAMLMLSLSHGVNGLVNAQYDSHPEGGGYPEMVGLIDTNYNPTPLWYELRDYSIPRLKGTLGKKLLALNYSGDTLYLGRHLLEDPNGFTNSGPTMTNRYLTLTEYTGGLPPPPVHFHTGFFSRPSHSLDNYFMLDNLITTDERSVWVTVAPPVSGFNNYRFRNIEGMFDTTFAEPMTKLITHPAGEGYLYQVAPVVIYGGKLINPETISNETTLFDEMIIQNGATLTVNATYNVDRDIRIKAGGSIITTNGGTLQFNEGSKLIIEGVATIAGTVSHNLILDFVSPENSNGIIINPGGSLNISYCEVKNAVKGINWELNAVYLNAQHVDFTDCDSVSINILGREMGDGPTPPVPLIKDCTIINSMDGISVANLSEITIQLNSITNTDLGIYLSSVTNAHVITNQINSNTEALEGILLLSSGGDIWGNTVTGHTVGIHLGNSSPKIGVNTITANKYHGIYIGTGSFPYMNGEYVGTPPKGYTLSGYNKIKENGGWEEVGGPSHNDGSEIYFFSSNAVLAYGCNSIYDDREPSPPLINTLLLMNGYRFGFPTIQAQYNFWGDTVYAARFGNLNVTYEPYWLNSCDSEGGGEDELIVRTSYGEAIDTLYSTGTEVPELTMTELAYAEADGYFLTGNLTDALQIYEGIITGNATNEEKYLAYERKYEIGRLTGQSNEFFNAMGNTFNTLATNAEDSIRVKIFMQLATLCKVGEEEYVPAITEFDEIVQQNPNTEEAVYAEIDALTTALLVEDEDSSLHKGRLGKYLVKTSGDYNRRVDDILRKNFGSDAKESEKDLLPTEYTLYQNFPNPFNPITTIKYDLPNAGEVSLIIYDILGRRVKQLVNDKQQPGRYEIKFDASNLASGVYIYQLITDKYINAKKMILLK